MQYNYNTTEDTTLLCAHMWYQYSSDIIEVPLHLI
jgi:hypothetical protein